MSLNNKEMKKIAFMSITLMAIFSTAMMSCSEKDPVEPNIKPEGSLSRGYWEGDQFIELKTDDQTKYLVMPRRQEHPISSEEVQAILASMDVEIESTDQSYPGRYWVKASTRPEHPSLYVSNKYKSNVNTLEKDYLFILPTLFVGLEKGVSLDAFIEKYTEHLKLNRKWLDFDEGVIYIFDCDCSNSDEVLDLIMEIHKEETVRLCEPDINAPIILD